VRRAAIRVLSPTFIVGAICVIERPDGCVLLVRQSYRRHWGFPGGLLKRHESVDDAARREVLEEVGLVIELVGEPTVVVNARHHLVDVIFRAVPIADVGTSIDADGVVDVVPDSVVPRSVEIVEARWFPPDQLPDLQVEASGALVALARAGRPEAQS
jgi:8-oxo-dGTP pyrophosphatase MutT (NUDIX family)